MLTTSDKKFKQGIFIPKNKEKWINCQKNMSIRFLSSWEHKFLTWADNNSSVLLVGSECLPIPYPHPFKKKMTIYLPDIYMKVQEQNGEIKQYVIEIKPSKETIKPTQVNGNRKKRSTIIYEQATYTINICKWTAAQKYCEKNGIIFKLVTEKDIRI